jgi:hypothetical protein
VFSQLSRKQTKRLMVLASLGINARPYQKIMKSKKVRGMAHVVEYLPKRART